MTTNSLTAFAEATKNKTANAIAITRRIKAIISTLPFRRVLMTISRHKTRAVFDRYNIVSESNLIDAARKIEQGREIEFGHSFWHSDDHDHGMDRAKPLV